MVEKADQFVQSFDLVGHHLELLDACDGKAFAKDPLQLGEDVMILVVRLQWHDDEEERFDHLFEHRLDLVEERMPVRAARRRTPRTN